MYTQERGLGGILKNLTKQRKQQIRILILGLDNSGKTTIVKALSNQDITTTTPTQGFNIKNLTHNNLRLNIWDIGGQKAMRQYWSNCFKDTSALIYVIDSADTKRILQSGLQLQNLLIQKALSGVPLLIFANKQDLMQALQPDQILDGLKIGQIKNRKWCIVACSAKSYQGIEEGLNWLIQTIKK